MKLKGQKIYTCLHSSGSVLLFNIFIFTHLHSSYFYSALVGFMGYAMFFLVESKIGSGMASYDLAQYSTFGFTVYSAFMACGLYLCIDGTFWPIKWILDWYIW